MLDLRGDCGSGRGVNSPVGEVVRNAGALPVGEVVRNAGALLVGEAVRWGESALGGMERVGSGAWVGASEKSVRKNSER